MMVMVIMIMIMMDHDDGDHDDGDGDDHGDVCKRERGGDALLGEFAATALTSLS